MKIFVISLSDADNRRKNIQSQLNTLGLDFEFFDAVDGRQGIPEIYSHMVDRHTARKNIGRYMHDVEICCALSHALVYEKIIAQNIPHCLILEDDAIIDIALADILQQKILQNVPQNFVILNHFRVRKSIFDMGIKLYKQYRMYTSVGDAYCAGGYYIDTQMAHILKTHNTPITHLADWPLNVNKYAVFTYPRIIQQPPMNIDHSTIKSSRNNTLSTSKVTVYKTTARSIGKILLTPYYIFGCVMYKMFDLKIMGKNTDEKLKYFYTLYISKYFHGP